MIPTVLFSCKTNHPLPVSVLGSPVECGVQSKLLLLQFSGQANYRQRVEHSGMSIFNDLFPLISLSKQSGIKVGGGGRKRVGCCVGGVVLRDNLVLSTELTM